MSTTHTTCLIPLTFTLIITASFAAVLPTRRDTTITVPDGVQYYPAENLICTPTTWTSVAVFFLGNYLSHAATVIAFPGEANHFVVLNMILAVLSPAMGAARGLLAIIRHAALYRDPIKQALRSRALCMVVRSDEWKPRAGEKMRSLSYLPRELRREDDDVKAYEILSKLREERATVVLALLAER
jgi:hypothetical protein